MQDLFYLENVNELTVEQQEMLKKRQWEARYFLTIENPKLSDNGTDVIIDLIFKHPISLSAIIIRTIYTKDQLIAYSDPEFCKNEVDKKINKPSIAFMTAMSVAKDEEYDKIAEMYPHAFRGDNLKCLIYDNVERIVKMTYKELISIHENNFFILRKK